MNETTKERMRGGLNQYVENCGLFVSAFNVGNYGKNDTQTINYLLEEWQRRGILKIKKRYDECQPDDICVKMLNFIDCEPPHDRFWENPHLIKQLNED